MILLNKSQMKKIASSFKDTEDGNEIPVYEISLLTGYFLIIINLNFFYINNFILYLVVNIE